MTEETQSHPHPTSPPDAGWALSVAGRDTAEAYLKEHTRLARLQADELIREDRIRHWSLRFSHASTVMKVAFELSLALIFLIVAAVVVGTIWSAHEASGLVIEAFQVPPDLAGRGLSGQVVASRLLDKVSHLQDATDSLRAPSSYADNWGDDIKVQIPDTGVSIGEAVRYLKQALGRETHITGAIWRQGDGVAVVARAGADEGTVFTGKDSELDALLQKAAEAVFERTQPYRAAVYYAQRNQQPQADAILHGLLVTAPPHEKAWVIALLSNDDYQHADFRAAIAKSSQAVAFDPDNALAPENRAEGERELGWDEAALADFRRTFALMTGDRSDLNPAKLDVAVRFAQAQILMRLGDFTTAERLTAEVETMPNYSGSAANSYFFDMWLKGALHDRSGVARMAAAPLPGNNVDRHFRLYFQTQAQVLSGDPRAGIATYRALLVSPAGPNLKRFMDVTDATMPRAFHALALAETGDFAGADAAVAGTPTDCDSCMVVRGEIATREKQWDRAALWLAAAEKHAPSLPFADEAWGRMLLARGDAAGAIAKFERAHGKGARYADALEGLGEALMAANRSDLALAKFAEADTLAPHWSRLHWQWSLALAYLGRKDEAATQLARAKTP